MSESVFFLLLRGTWETLVMTFVSGFFGFLVGLPLGIFLFLSQKGQMLEHFFLNQFISILVNVFRSIPFIILLVWLIPFTRALVGTSIGLKAALVSLSIGAIPFVARMVESALMEVPSGLIEAARAMGASLFQMIYKVLIPESLCSLINAACISLISLVGYSAMGGAIGAGGLGQIGYQYGYIGYDFLVMNSVLVLLILLVFLIQFTGDKLSRRFSHK